MKFIPAGHTLSFRQVLSLSAIFVGAVTVLASTAYVGGVTLHGQLASVSSADCSLQSEIDELSAKVAPTEASVKESIDQISAIDTKILSLQTSIEKNTVDADKLKIKLIAEKTIVAEKAAVDLVNSEMTDRKILDDTDASVKELYLHMVADLSLVTKTTDAAKIAKQAADAGVIQLEAKKKIEAAMIESQKTQDKQIQLSKKLSDWKPIDTKEKAVIAAKKALDDANKGNNRTLKSTTLATYNSLLDPYNKAVANFNSIYGTTVLPSNTTTRLAVITNEYNAAVSAATQAAVTYKNLNTPYTQKYGLTKQATDLNTLQNAVALLKSDSDKKNAELSTLKPALLAEQTKYAADLDNLNKLVAKYNASYYKTRGAVRLTTAQLTKKLADLTAVYSRDLAVNDKINTSVQQLEDKSKEYSETIATLAVQKAEVKIKQATAEQALEDLKKTITDNTANLCAPTETFCSNAIDDDRDGKVDCEDSDCLGESVCVKGETEKVIKVNVPLQVVSVSPAENSKKVEPSIGQISIVFNQNITYSGGQVDIRGSAGDTVDIGGVTAEGSILNVQIQSSSPFQYNETYTVSINAQITGDSDNSSGLVGYSWQFTTDIDPNIGAEGGDDADGDYQLVGGIKSFFKKTINKNCCVCAYGDVKPGQTFKKACSDLFRENSCDVTNTVYAATPDQMNAALADFPNQCPTDKYMTVSFLVAEHGSEEGSESVMCEALPKTLIASYEIAGQSVPANMTVAHGQCNSFNNMDEAKKSADQLSQELQDAGYVNIKITIKGNQNNVGLDGNGRNNSICAGPAEFDVCADAVEIKLGECPEVGDGCLPSKDSNLTIQCLDNGVKSSRTCENTGRKSDFGVPLGNWKK